MASKQVIDRIAQQLSLPTKGLFGWITFHFLKRRNVGLERMAVELCGLEPHHSVLEVGFGPGYGLLYAYNCIKDGPGKACGVDLSPYMVEKASALLREPIRRGKVEVVLADVMRLPYASGTFHRAFHCNSYYFWPSLPQACREVRRVMRPGGLMVASLSLERIQEAKARGFLEYGDPDHDKYMAALEQAGFEKVRLEHFVKGEARYQAVFAHVPPDAGRAADPAVTLESGGPRAGGKK